MKYECFLVLVICLFQFHVNAQPENFFHIKTGHQILDQIPLAGQYFYDQFKMADFHFANGKIKKRKANLNCLFGQMQHLTEDGDTVLVDDGRLAFIAFERDTFFKDRFWFAVHKEYEKVKLVKRQVFVFVNKPAVPKQGTTYEVLSNPIYLKGLAAKDSFTMATMHLYYLLDVKNQVKDFDRQTISLLFPHKMKTMNEYFKYHQLRSFYKNEVEDFMEFLTSKQF